jgi:hypothetical protein
LTSPPTTPTPLVITITRPKSNTNNNAMQELDLLILGAGWTATFLIPHIRAHHPHLNLAATTRDGREVGGLKTIKWTFEPEDLLGGAAKFSALPLAKTILITFPVKGKDDCNVLITEYERTHSGKKARWMQLGSTGIWQITQSSLWTTRHSAYNTSDARAQAEDELLRHGGCVFNLSGLWGGSRQPRDWVNRVAKSKEDVRGKKSLHMIHGLDVARAVVAAVRLDQAGSGWELKAKGQRWMLTDGFVYDWWSLFAGWAQAASKESEETPVSSKGGDDPIPQAQWTYELMREEGVRALPRSMELLERCYDSREFWETFGLTPLRARMI